MALCRKDLYAQDSVNQFSERLAASVRQYRTYRSIKMAPDKAIQLTQHTKVKQAGRVTLGFVQSISNALTVSTPLFQRADGFCLAFLL